MNEAAIVDYITDSFRGLHVVTASGDTFFTYDPDRSLPEKGWWPFATVVTGDRPDQVSQLNRPSVYRLNIGIGKESFRSLFGNDTKDHDYTALDRLLPHPEYGSMYWVCVLNPGSETLETVKRLLAEAYDMAVEKHARPRRTEPS